MAATFVINLHQGMGFTSRIDICHLYSISTSQSYVTNKAMFDQTVTFYSLKVTHKKHLSSFQDGCSIPEEYEVTDI